MHYRIPWRVSQLAMLPPTKAISRNVDSELRASQAAPGRDIGCAEMSITYQFEAVKVECPLDIWSLLKLLIRKESKKNEKKVKRKETKEQRRNNLRAVWTRNGMKLCGYFFWEELWAQLLLMHREKRTCGWNSNFTKGQAKTITECFVSGASPWPTTLFAETGSGLVAQCFWVGALR